MTHCNDVEPVQLSLAGVNWNPSSHSHSNLPTLVGQNLGAGLADRAEKTTWKIAQYNAGYMAIAAVLMLLFDDQIASFFSDEPEVLGFAVQCLQIFAYGYVGWGFGMAVIQAFNGAGDTMTPTKINFVCYWMLQIPLAFALAKYAHMNASGVYLAIMIAESLLAVVGIMVFRRGTWKTKMV